MEKRLPLALLLSLLFVFVYLKMTAPPPPPPGAATASSGAGGAQPGNAAGAVQAPAPVGPDGAPISSGGAIPGATAPAAAPAEPGTPVAFEGTGYRAEFNTRGGALTWLELTDYHSAPKAADALRLLEDAGDGVGHFLVKDFNGRYPLDTSDWTLERGITEAGRAQLVFRYAVPDGLRFTRTITDRGDRDSFDLSLTVENLGGQDPGGTLTLVQQGPHGLRDDQAGTQFAGGVSAVAVVGGTGGNEVRKWAGKDQLTTGDPRRVADGEVLVAAGSMTNYFTSLLVPRQGTFASLVQPYPTPDKELLEQAVTDKKPLDAADAAKWRAELADKYRTNAAVNVVLAANYPAPGRSTQYEFRIYAGPKDRALVSQPGFLFLGPVIEDAYGHMAWINHALLAILEFFHGVTLNWGFAIVMLVVLVRLLLFPLNRVQQSSMARYTAAMQRLKPELDALKAKLKGNTRKFNEEQMKLLKREGVSPPLGGCLLMFVQFPVWVSLFQILRNAI
ncbi:MAG TPA: membrane protein insertase YidC, partial [Planctomycetota bacterium]|nr:membrane protein insertase YidC [Planctomycetota bacterium]